MNTAKDKLLARIVSGSIFLGGLVLKPPTREHRYIATEIYEEALRDGELEGLYSESELLDFMLENDLWDETKQKFVDDLPKEIEEFKVRLFKSTFKSNERKVIRTALATAKKKLTELTAERNAFNYLSAAGAASIAKSRYLLAVGLYKHGRRLLTDDPDEWPTSLLDEVMGELSSARVEDDDIRWLAHNEPWRSIWSATKVEGTVFGVSPVDYTEEQKSLVGWSSLYDSVYGHPDCPSDEVVNDNDLLDGWLIDQRRQRDGRLASKEVDDQLSDSTRNSQEVFIPAETVEDARKVFNRNDEMTKAVQKQRFSVLKEKGTVAEQDMPDTRRRIRMEATQRQVEAIKGNK